MTQVTCPVQSGRVLITSTPRLQIRDWELDDAPTVLDIFSRIEVMQWLGDPPVVLCPDLEEARAKIERWQQKDDPPCGQWAVEVTDGGPLHGRVIGAVLLVPLPNNEHGELEIGWHLHPDAWGQRFAPEAAVAILERGFNAGLEEIHAVTDVDNVKSMAVCRRIGMEHLGIVDRWYETPSQYFRITREQWQAARETAPIG